MRIRIRHISLAAAALALAGAAATGTAGAAVAADAAAEKGSALRLSAHLDGEQSTTTLLCRPSGGGHPDADSACRTLEAAGGDFDLIRPETGPCTMEMRPIILQAQGWWQGERVDWSSEYANPCVGSRATAGVFDFGG